MAVNPVRGAINAQPKAGVNGDNQNSHQIASASVGRERRANSRARAMPSFPGNQMDLGRID
jgi:hypothetical protein